jgi:peptidoglycan/xylan/chitin deacetylase (PgdA/CDA1 family)
MSEHISSHGLESQLLTRRQLLELGAAGLLGCCGLSACGDRSAIATTETKYTQIDAINDGAHAQEPAVRLHPPTTVQQTPLWLPGDVILGGDRNGPKIVAITSDDGPTPPYTGIKMANDMKAVGKEGLIDYMMVANNVLAFPEAAKQLYERGYGIANHSLTHASYVDRVIATEMQPAQDAIWSVLGYYPELFRAPGLTLGSHIIAEAKWLGLPIISTTTDIGDW